MVVKGGCVRGNRRRILGLALAAWLAGACGSAPVIPDVRLAVVASPSVATLDPSPTPPPPAIGTPAPPDVAIPAPAAVTIPARAAIGARVRRGATTAIVPVLMYHDFGEPPAGTRLRDLWLPTSAFADQLAALKARGWTTITAAQLGRAMQSGARVPARTFVISIDDGRVNNFTEAFPVLQRYGFVATFYIPAGLPGTPGQSSRMSYDQLAILANAGMEIANHTMTHASLPRVDATQLATEITGAGERLRSELAARGVTTDITTFAYPYGRVSPAATELLARDGYTLAVTTVAGEARIGLTAQLLCPRVRVHGAETLPRFLATMGA
jgi:peptidoglycan/xylan/chitin deacetylase (PgdA/CDA1 family)